MASRSVLERAFFIEAMVRALPETLQPIIGEDSCVLSSRVGRALLREAGINAEMVPVRAVILNRAMWDFLDGDVTRVWVKMTPEQEAECEARGAYSVGLGYVWKGEEIPEGRFPGHMVLVTRNPDRIVDLTLNQSSRPRYGMPLEPSVFELERADLRRWLRREDVVTFEDTESGVRMFYVSVSDELDRRSGIRWRDGEERLTPAEVVDVEERLLVRARRATERRLRTLAEEILSK